MATRWEEYVEHQVTLRVEYGVLSRRWTVLQSVRVGLIVLGFPLLSSLTGKYYELLLISGNTVWANKILMLTIPSLMGYVLHLIFMTEAFLSRVVRGLHIRGLRIEREMGVDSGLFSIGDMEYMPQNGLPPISWFNESLESLIFIAQSFAMFLSLIAVAAVLGWIQ